MNDNHQVNLQALARQSMLEHGFHPDFSAAVRKELQSLESHAPDHHPQAARDLRQLLWSSIDNDTSRDLDQIEFAQEAEDGPVRIQIAIADVDAFVPAGSAIDKHASDQTTTVYTGVHNFSMLPDELSTGLTSLLEDQERLGVVYEFSVDGEGCVGEHNIYRASVRNHAQLAYPSVGAWLNSGSNAPPKVASSSELQKQLLLQNRVAQVLRKERYRRGALNLQTIETHPLMTDGKPVDIETQQKTPANDLIEDFMIAANEVVARSLERAGFSSIRRVVKTPKRWDRIVEVAAQFGTKLPGEPDSKALQDFLCDRRAVDPDHFPDLSLTVVKLLGSGEYVLERVGETAPGHFGLAVQDYTHSTAPNRRYADLVTQRLIKAMLAKRRSPYSDDELAAIAQQCTKQEDAARKVEREMGKRIAAVVMRSRIGQSFTAIVTGVNEHGSFVRTTHPHVEGMLVRGQKGVDVGDKLNVTLVHTDPERGYIDFARS
ncbi:RNB domain-containing ribonuclease [Alloacidobacterium dinghuense]|uniref:RNB domain-containing ribonuclease n=1 Tax=Alloacidobacterium dinghuense TaxID=2763107 RepID=A0A7G8BIE6_9BACT|nr:RNB domain-containing ribonuclease [Alloacidobacterium dinghuense]QNI32316.1 RNB domain-containing ribonuclease [Alloacidobacterium dinghuense]